MNIWPSLRSSSQLKVCMKRAGHLSHSPSLPSPPPHPPSPSPLFSSVEQRMTACSRKPLSPTANDDL